MSTIVENLETALIALGGHSIDEDVWLFADDLPRSQIAAIAAVMAALCTAKHGASSAHRPGQGLHS